MAWSETKGTIVTSNIIPTNAEYDTYPTHHANFGRGGYKTVSSLEERDKIPVDRLTLGTEVRVTLSDGTSTVYYVSKLPATITDSSTGADCEWTEVKSGGLDDLATLKGQPNGLAELDSSGQVPEAQSRAIIYRGTYVDETTFNSASGSPHVKKENAIYIDSTTGRMYSYTNGIFTRDTIYWEEVK